MYDARHLGRPPLPEREGADWGMLWRYADLKFLYRIQTGPNADLVQSIIDPVFQVDV
jgi:hypothetical protein